jgi:hypothetical protein
MDKIKEYERKKRGMKKVQMKAAISELYELG